jgi:hypothetical protein
VKTAGRREGPKGKFSRDNPANLAAFRPRERFR